MNTVQTSVEVQQQWQAVNAINIEANQPKPITMDSILSGARRERRMGRSMWGKK